MDQSQVKKKVSPMEVYMVSKLGRQCNTSTNSLRAQLLDEKYSKEMEQETEKSDKEIATVPSAVQHVVGDNSDMQSVVKEELKKQFWLSAPLIGVSLLQYSLQVISVMFVGHLGSLPLSAASIATSFASVTDFTFLMGTASALETLCGQSYGAKMYGKLGIYMQRAMFVLLILSIPLSIIWFYTENILVFVHQDKSIAKPCRLIRSIHDPKHLCVRA